MGREKKGRRAFIAGKEKVGCEHNRTVLMVIGQGASERRTTMVQYQNKDQMQ